MFSFPGPDGDLQLSSQELIDRQSQDFVDERLAEFQAQIHQLQGEYRLPLSSGVVGRTLDFVAFGVL